MQAFFLALLLLLLFLLIWMYYINITQSLWPQLNWNLNFETPILLSNNEDKREANDWPHKWWATTLTHYGFRITKYKKSNKNNIVLKYKKPLERKKNALDTNQPTKYLIIHWFVSGHTSAYLQCIIISISNEATNQPAIEPPIHLSICLLLNSYKKKKKKKKIKEINELRVRRCVGVLYFKHVPVVVPFLFLLLFFSYRFSYWAVTMAFKQGRRDIFCFFFRFFSSS